MNVVAGSVCNLRREATDAPPDSRRAVGPTEQSLLLPDRAAEAAVREPRPEPGPWSRRSAASSRCAGFLELPPHPFRCPSAEWLRTIRHDVRPAIFLSDRRS